MKAPVKSIRVSQRARDTLVTLKRRTGIEHWYVLCRWAFADSLANPNKPVPVTQSADSNLEMSWDQFAGELSDYLLTAFVLRATKDGVPVMKAEMAAYFRSHLERGITQLQTAGDLPELFRRALQSSGKSKC